MVWVDEKSVVLHANQSLSWEANTTVWLSLLLLSVIMAASFALIGAWPVFIFAGAEMLLLAALLYRVVRRCARQEVLRLQGDTLVVESGGERLEKRQVLSCETLRVFFNPADAPGLHDLCLSSQSKSLIVGDFLSEEEKEQVLRTLRNWGLRCHRSAWIIRDF